MLMTTYLISNASLCRLSLAPLHVFRHERLHTSAQGVVTSYQYHAPVIVSVSLAFAFAELNNLDALGRARPNESEFHDADAQHPHEVEGFPLFLCVRDAENPWHIRARMFALLDNVTKDPATGIASAALGAYLASRVGEGDVTVKATV
jgi:trans-2,3-dihydro-3-hydroxyanthranilate isomerase